MGNFHFNIFCPRTPERFWIVRHWRRTGDSEACVFRFLVALVMFFLAFLAFIWLQITRAINSAIFEQSFPHFEEWVPRIASAAGDRWRRGQEHRSGSAAISHRSRNFRLKAVENPTEDQPPQLLVKPRLEDHYVLWESPCQGSAKGIGNGMKCLKFHGSNFLCSAVLSHSFLLPIDPGFHGDLYSAPTLESRKNSSSRRECVSRQDAVPIFSTRIALHRNLFS